jgi:beta-barrel assembly-enhancing protease
MGGLFYTLGRMAGPHVRKARWAFQSMTGNESDAIQAEFEVGRDLARGMADAGQIDPDPRAERVLSGVGRQLAARLTNRQRHFAFYVMRDPRINAFALPGGFIFVTGSLLVLCGGEIDELAFVLGHEMAHVVRGHAMSRMVSSTVMNVVAKAGPVSRVARGPAVALGLRLLQSAYSQDQELEADAFAIQLMVSAGFDPAAGVSVLRKLSEQGGSGTDAGPASYFSSHPPLAARTAQINRLLLKGRA